MPKRMLDDSLLSSPSLAKCSPRAQDAWPRFLLLMDDFGCSEANPRVLLGRGWPLRNDVTEADVAHWLEEYVGAGMACLWTETERRFVHLTGWFGPHGQRQRAEYDGSTVIGRKGSKRKTPPPPADLVAAVVAGARRDADGKPPGVDRETTDPAATSPRESDREIVNDSVPGRDCGGNQPGNVISRGGSAPAVPDAVPDADAGKTLAPSPSASTPVPALFESESPVAAVLPCSGSAKSYGVTLSQITSWQSAYPGVDVLAEVERARVWLEANPARRKTHGGMARFLVAWMTRAQDSPRGKPAARAATVAAAPASAFTGGKREF